MGYAKAMSCLLLAASDVRIHDVFLSLHSGKGCFSLLYMIKKTLK